MIHHHHHYHYHTLSSDDNSDNFHDDCHHLPDTQKQTLKLLFRFVWFLITMWYIVIVPVMGFQEEDGQSWLKDASVLVTSVNTEHLVFWNYKIFNFQWRNRSGWKHRSWWHCRKPQSLNAEAFSAERNHSWIFLKNVNVFKEFTRSTSMKNWWKIIGFCFV